eukprot:8822353-Prorocentrum_lima.AAC.1
MLGSSSGVSVPGLSAMLSIIPRRDLEVDEILVGVVQLHCLDILRSLDVALVALALGRVVLVLPDL